MSYYVGLTCLHPPPPTLEGKYNGLITLMELWSKEGYKFINKKSWADVALMETETSQD